MIEETQEENKSEVTNYNDEGLLTVPNGTRNDPRQQVCWDYYVESFLEGNPSARAAALKAGYSESAAERVSVCKWFKDRVKTLKRNGMLSRAEKNLEKVLKMNYTRTRTKDGETYDEVDTDILKVVVDVSKAIVKTLGKDEGYSDRKEVTGKDGEPVVFMPIELLQKHGLNNND